MKKTSSKNLLRSGGLLRLVKTVMALGLSGALLYYAWFVYSQLPEFQQRPEISQIKQINKTVVDRVVSGAEKRENRPALNAAGVNDPFTD